MTMNMEKQQDLVSVIMPSYNTEKFILQAIQSVCTQRWRNWELIVVDDCSTDRSVEFVKEYISLHMEKRIQLFVNEENRGAAYCRNFAISQAKGRWIAFLDSDDLWESDKLDRQIKFMEENGYHFSYTEYFEIDEEGDFLGRIVSGPAHITEHDMYNYCWPGCLTVMYDQDYIGEKIQIAEIKKHNDYAMWLKVIKHADCYLLEDILSNYRRREGSASNEDYIELIKWHYKLFRESEGMGVMDAIAFTVRNLIFGCWKKIRYIMQDYSKK